MTRSYYIIISILLVSCSENGIDSKKIEIQDSTSIFQETPKDSLKRNEVYRKEVSEEFMDLVMFIDSMNYRWDTLRAKKTYEHHDSSEYKITNGYLFYEIQLQNTAPYKNREFIKRQLSNIELSDTLNYNRMIGWRERWGIDTNLLDQVKSIKAYFFVTKEPYINNGIKTFVDGTIEEWKFPDTLIAKSVAKDIADKASRVYINTGAYVCYLDEYVYVFYSRSAGFYTPLKRFWNYLIDQQNAVIPDGEIQRMDY